jgi:predicted S18 family serine protease
MKKDVKEVIQGEEPHLNNLLTQEDLSSFKGMVDELRDTWTKKQMFRTETEARFSVLQDNRYPTKAAKYWQCVREQSSYLDNLMTLSFEYRRNEAKIKWLEGKVEKEEDEYKATKYQIDLDEARFGKASMEKVAKHRMREIKMWSKLKSEFNDGSFNDKDVNQHQLESYGLMYAGKAKTITDSTSEAEVFNIMGQLQSLQRIKASGELENKTEKKEQITNDLGEKPKV